MQNGIIIPLDSSSLAGQTLLGPLDLDVTAMVWVADGVVTRLPITGGSGSGAKATVTIAGGGTAMTQVEITTAGSGYSVGDVLSIAGNTTNFTGSIGFTVTANMLNAEGSTVYVVVPRTGQITSVIPPQPIGDFGTISIAQIQPGARRKWELGVEGVTANNSANVAEVFDRAVLELYQNPGLDVNLRPLPPGVSVSSGSLKAISGK
tara:strand:+ start:1110 stop:1727 length:618 start_codon:yes stop_codon:yes gene_type:complete